VLPDFWEVLIKLDIVAVVFAALTSLAFIFLGFKLYSVRHVIIYLDKKKKRI
jgi:hypothetical protein